MPRPCPGCGLVREPADGPTHAYIGASPGCWAAFNELMSADLAGGVSGQLVEDTYAAQHPGVEERRAVQSVCVHLVVLCATLERGWPADLAVRLRRRAVERPPEPWRWLDPVVPLGSKDVAWPLASDDAAERGRRVRLWAEDVWDSWSEHHPRVRGWVDDLLA